MTQRFLIRHTQGICVAHSLSPSTWHPLQCPSEVGTVTGMCYGVCKAEKDKPWFLEESASFNSWNVANIQCLPILNLRSCDVKFSVFSFTHLTSREFIFHFLLAKILFYFSVSPYPTSQFHKVLSPGDTAICYSARCTMVSTFHPMTPHRRPHPAAVLVDHSLINTHCVLDTQLTVQVFRNKCEGCGPDTHSKD